MDKQKIARISESEWEVMRVLWDAEKPLTAAEVTQRLEGRADWKPKTVRTFLTRLAKKLAISAEKIGPAGFELLHYAPLVDEPTTLHAGQETFLGRFFDGTIQSMLAAYIESGNISQGDLRELRAKKLAETVKSKVEELVNRILANTSYSQETARWLGGIDDKLCEKLSTVGLVEAKKTVRLADQLERYIKAHSGGKEPKPKRRTGGKIVNDILEQAGIPKWSKLFVSK